MTSLGSFFFGVLIVILLVLAWAALQGLGAWFGTVEHLVR